MSVKAEALTLLPALLLFGIAAYLGFLSLKVLDDWGLKQQLSLYSLIIFHIGIVLAICWVIYWIIHSGIAKNE